MFEIINNLYLGDNGDSSDPELETFGLVVNCTNDLPFYFETIYNIRVGVEDNPDSVETTNETLYKTFPQVINDIEKFLNNNQKVLIHCYMGRQRSATVVAAYILTKNRNNGVTVDDVINYIKLLKKDAFFPEARYKPALERWAITLS